MNALAQYLQKNSITQEAFARQIGRTQATVSRLAAGGKAPSPELARRIHDETSGAVPFHSWPPYSVFAPEKARAS